MAAMEADFLRSLGETRRMEAAFRRTIAAVEGTERGAKLADAGDEPGAPLDTRLGFARGTRRRTAALAASAASVSQAIEGARRRFAELRQGCRVRMCWTLVLPCMPGKQCPSPTCAGEHAQLQHQHGQAVFSVGSMSPWLGVPYPIFRISNQHTALCWTLGLAAGADGV